LGQTDNLVQLLNLGVLLVNRKLGVTDNVEKEDVRDFEFDLFLKFGSHMDFTWKCTTQRYSKVGCRESSAKLVSTYLYRLSYVGANGRTLHPHALQTSAATTPPALRLMHIAEVRQIISIRTKVRF